MERKRLMYQAGLSLVLVMIISLGSWEAIKAQECRIIRIHGRVMGQSAIALEPRTMWVPKDTCVVWYNGAINTRIKIVFEEGKACVNATDAPMGFGMDYDSSCYVTSWVPVGGTSSLTFKEKGSYLYTIETAPADAEVEPDKGKKLAEGTIHVYE